MVYGQLLKFMVQGLGFRVQTPAGLGLGFRCQVPVGLGLGFWLRWV